MTPAALERIAQFRRHLTNERRLSPHTDTNYARDLAALVAECGRSGIEDWPTLDGQHIRLFAKRSHAAGLQARSIQRRLSAWRSFFEYLLRERVLRTNPAADIRAPKAPKRLPGTLDADLMGRLLEMPVKDPLAARDLAIMELLYSSGLRLAELIGLATSDLDLDDRTVRVLGKGRKERVVPVGRKAVLALRRWQDERRHLAGKGETALFVGRNGSRMSPRAVQTRVQYWARRQGIDLRVYPHLFRHSFASHLVESGGDLRGVQEMLGHADISTTQIYTHLDFQHLARTYEAAHPRARKKNRAF